MLPHQTWERGLQKWSYFCLGLSSLGNKVLSVFPLKQFPLRPFHPSSQQLMRSVFSGNDCLREKLPLEEDGGVFEVLPGFSSLGLQKTLLV